MKVALLAASIVTLASCSNPKDASKANFQKAINEWIEKGGPCLSTPDGTVEAPDQKSGTFPVYVDADRGKSAFSEENRQRHLAPLDALVDAGLMRSTPTQIEKKELLGLASKKVAVTAYELTDAGRKAYSADAGRAVLGGVRSGFCYGKPRVDQITNFTEPADTMGMTVSQVSYTFHLADLPAWATNARVLAAFPEVARNTAADRAGKAAVVLTNDGWKHEKAIGRQADGPGG